MKKNKINAVVINPSSLIDSLLKNKSFLVNYNCNFLDLNNINFDDLKQILENSDIIIIDEFDPTEVSEKIISIFNHYRVVENKIINTNQIFEIYYKKVPIIHLAKNRFSSHELFNIKISKHIEYSKRFFDILLVIISFPISLLLFLVGAILIKLTSRGPIVFKQKRVGKNGKSFYLFKLRTMIYLPEGHNTHTIENDHRIFPVGRFLRFSKIDEIPQFLNVLMGQMSLIGPRPEKTEIVEKLNQENPFYEFRHLIRPGITGWAQVNDPKATPDQNLEKLEYDLYYVKNASFLLDMEIVFKTLGIIIRRDSM